MYSTDTLQIFLKLFTVLIINLTFLVNEGFHFNLNVGQLLNCSLSMVDLFSLILKHGFQFYLPLLVLSKLVPKLISFLKELSQLIVI